MPVRLAAPAAARPRGPLSVRRLSLLSVGGAVLIWSTSFVATKLALPDIPPLTLAAARSSLAAGLLLALASATGRLPRPSLSDALRFVAGGLLGISGYFALENLGVRFATAADAALLVAAYPAITLLLEPLVYRTPVSWNRLEGAGVAMLGVALIVYGGFDGGGGRERLLGDLLLLASGIVWAFYNFVTRSSMRTSHALTVTCSQTVAGAVALLPLAWLERDRWQAPSGGSLLAVTYLGVFCSVLAFLLYAHGLRGVGAGTAVGLMNLVPVFGLILAVLVLAEPIRTIQVAGGMTVIVGITMGVRQPAPATVGGTLGRE